MPSVSKPGPGQATRKGRSAGRTTGKGGARTTASGRYTPPIPRRVRTSPKWLGPLILALLVIGVLTIVLNYFDVLPASPTNWYLLGGILFIACGFATATQYR